MRNAIHDMPRVLLVGNYLSSSVGVRGVCEELADRLAASGWDVLRASSRPGRLARLADMLATTWTHRHDYDLAHVDVYSGPAFFLAEAVAFALRRAHKPYALTLHGGGLPQFARGRERRVRNLLASAEAVTAPSGFLAEEMQRYHPDIRLVPNAIDLARYPFRLRNGARPRLVWVRAFHDIYDPTLAIRTLALLRARIPEITLEMVGPDKHDGSLERARAAAVSLGVDQAVGFRGAVQKSEIPAAIDRGDIFLNTTTIDNTPVSVVEAMACGACIVSTNVGGIPHLLRAGVDALLVNSGDERQMASAVERLLGDPALAARLSQAARTKAEAFDWSAVLPEWQTLLGSLRRTAWVSPGLRVSGEPL